MVNFIPATDTLTDARRAQEAQLVDQQGFGRARWTFDEEGFAKARVAALDLADKQIHAAIEDANQKVIAAHHPNAVNRTEE